MKCPHCAMHFHENWFDQLLFFSHQTNTIGWWYGTTRCPACKKWIIRLREGGGGNLWRLVEPSFAVRGPVPPEVPPEIAQDYREACDVLPISPKASAALSRRCLQNILHAHGYKARDLSKEIDALLNESDPRKAIPNSLAATIDGIRNFGNFSAHPLTDVTSLQVINVEDHEAEWCLEILEEMFEHFYVKPAQAAAKKAALNAKLAGAGKPPAK
jgi:hypothetical protein